MASFVDLMANDVWSEVDIVARTEAMIASEFPANDVAILNRKATAALLGQYTLSEEEQQEIARYAQVCQAAKEAGDAARADMALLQAAMDYESGLVAEASEEVLALVALRNPESTTEEPAEAS